MEVINQICPNCSGRLEHTGGGILVCPFCDAEFFSKTHAEHADEIRASKQETKEEHRQLNADEIARIVQDAIEDYEEPDGYGVQIGLGGKRMSKEGKARANFSIPNDEDIYMIYDETMFGSCKQGYVITNDAFYMKDTDGELVAFPWDCFGEAKIKEKDSTDLTINNRTITLTGGNGRQHTYDMLREIKKRLG